MKKNKLLNRLILLLGVITFTLNSCSNEGIYVQSSAIIPENQISSGIEITEDLAREVALNFYNKTYNSRNYLKSNNNKSTIIQSAKVQSTETIKDFNNQTAIYTVNIEPNGFVLVSSNTKNVPIVAHSETGVFEFNENSPDGLKSWIAENILFNDILETREPIEEVEQQWDAVIPYSVDRIGDDNPDDGSEGSGDSSSSNKRYSHTVNEQAGPLMQTTWGQGFPYNFYTNNNPTGCVAVAMAQIMRYHEWPNTFNWPTMPNLPLSTTAGLEVASLMFDIGLPENVNMQYSPGSSSANSEDVRNVLVNNYGYSSTATYSAYDFSTVKQEIGMYNRPVYMRGSHTYETETNGWWFWEQTTTYYLDGHAWVCDGYKQQYDLYIYNEGTQYEYTAQENRYEWLYMNWGWNGSGNGWFYKNNIWVNNVLITLHNGNVENPNFQYSRKCIYRIKP
ncbi:MAG: C10 family peptidase [Lutibacter sp.]|uniref:C10 family peptidase n=1 Tax=Lutibacter sp. TaxID=1925666 RepID=UPI00385D4394